MSAENKALRAIRGISLGSGIIVETIEKIFHIEDLFELAKQNSFSCVSFFELICNINYVILYPEPSIGGVLLSFGAETFENTVEGKVKAIAACFKHQANKLDDVLSTENLAAFMSATGIGNIASDTIKAYLGATKVTHNVKTSVKSPKPTGVV